MHDFVLLDKLKKKEPINLPKLLLLHMEYLSKNSTVLCLGRLVKKILQEQEVYANPPDEVSLVRKFDESIFKKMGMIFDDEKGWIKDEKKKPVEVDVSLSSEEEEDDDNPVDVMRFDRRIKTMEEDIKGMKAQLERIEDMIGRILNSVSGQIRVPDL